MFPYDIFSRIVSFETNKTNTLGLLWMLHDPFSFQKIAKIEYSVEKMSHEDLMSSGFKSKKNLPLSQMMASSVIKRLGLQSVANQVKTPN